MPIKFVTHGIILFLFMNKSHCKFVVNRDYAMFREVDVLRQLYGRVNQIIISGYNCRNLYDKNTKNITQTQT